VHKKVAPAYMDGGLEDVGFMVDLFYNSLLIVASYIYRVA